MIPLASPPSEMTVTAADRLARGGGWRKWRSTAQAVTSFRETFRLWALQNQDGRCAFCRLPIGVEHRRTNTIDHFAPKGLHAYWTYEPLNLLAVCESCNSEVKGEWDPVIGTPLNPFPYEDAVFEILHPYLDLDFSTHLDGGLDASGNEPRALRGLSPRGVRTISALRLDDQGIVAMWIQEWKSAQWDKTKALLPEASQVTYEDALRELTGHS
jgi:hypothetical protein